MELKLMFAELGSEENAGSNRTFMELKYATLDAAPCTALF